jgi:hypothetical protein
VAAAVVVTAPASARPTGAPAPADPAVKAEAIAHFDRGLALYDAGAWSAALAEFVEARRLYPLHNALYQASLCLEKLERYDEALELLDVLLGELDAAASPRVRENVQRRIDAMRSLVGEVTIVEAEQGAKVAIDGVVRGVGPLPGPRRVPAGERVVRVWKEGFQPFEQRIVVVGAKNQRLVARLEPLARRDGRIELQAAQAATMHAPPPVATNAAPPSGSAWRVPVGALATGIGALVTATGAAFGLKAIIDVRESDPSCPHDQCTTVAAFRQNQDAHTAAHVADIAVPTGLAVAAGGLYLLLRRPAPAARVGGAGPGYARLETHVASTTIRFTPAAGPGATSLVVSAQW